MTFPLKAIDAAFELLPAKMDSAEARVLLLAIGLQESRFLHRRQLVGNPPRPTGPAMGFWQFEKGGGVKGVLTHDSSKTHARRVCEAQDVPAEAQAVWTSLQDDDVLAAAFARLLLWTDPKALPEVGDVDGAWSLYHRTWRPGAYDRGTAQAKSELRAKWGRNYAQAMEAV